MKEKYIKAHMKAAYVYADLSYCEREKVGCVIVKDDSIIAIGYNGTYPGEDNSCEDENGTTLPHVIHAEDNAFRKLTKSYVSAKGGALFVTKPPCKPCASRIIEAGITHVYYTGKSSTSKGIEYLQENNIVLEYIQN